MNRNVTTASQYDKECILIGTPTGDASSTKRGSESDFESTMTLRSRAAQSTGLCRPPHPALPTMEHPYQGNINNMPRLMRPLAWMLHLQPEQMTLL